MLECIAWYAHMLQYTLAPAYMVCIDCPHLYRPAGKAENVIACTFPVSVSLVIILLLVSARARRHVSRCVSYT